MKDFFKKGLFGLIVFLMAFSLNSCDQQKQEVVKQEALNKIIKRGTLIVGMEAGYMPFEMRAKDGSIIGFDVDMVTEIAKAMGVKLKLVNTNWDGIGAGLMTDKFDMIASGMTITQGRNLQFNFANPYISVGQTILLKKSLASKIKSYKDLNNPRYKVGSKLGTTGEQATKRMVPRATYRSYDTEQEGTLDLLDGKIDAFIYDLPFNSIMASEKGKGKIVHLDQPFTFEPLGWAVQKGNHDFLNWLNNFLYQVKHDGTYDKIYAKWFKSVEWRKNLK